MNKYIFILVIFLCLSGLLLAQKPVTELHAGILMPKGAQNGFIGGISMGRAIDNNLAWAVEADYYVRTYTEETEVPGGGSGSATGKDWLAKIPLRIKVISAEYSLIISSLVLFFRFYSIRSN